MRSDALVACAAAAMLGIVPFVHAAEAPIPHAGFCGPGGPDAPRVPGRDTPCASPCHASVPRKRTLPSCDA